MHPGGIMLKARALALVAAAVVSVACATIGSGPTSGEVISRADAAKSLVLPSTTSVHRRWSCARSRMDARCSSGR
jgi:hypothetical protein